MIAIWWTVPSSEPINTTTPLVNKEGKGVWAATLPLPTNTSLVLEYVVIANWENNSTQLVIPIEGAQSVVILEL